MMEGEFLNPSELYERIQNTCSILSNFTELRNPDISRSQYISILLQDICLYYGYSEYLATKLFQLFSPAEAVQFFEASQVQRPVTVRTNTLKIRRKDLAQNLIGRGMNLDPVEWSKEGLQIFDSSVPVGATPEYMQGLYMLQAAASFLPVMALNPQKNEKILDLCAAPGGKTTFIAQRMKNSGILFSNDSSADRMKALVANVHRMGITNVIASAMDGRKFKVNGFDRVLLDAPCSGTGVISKDPSIKTHKTKADISALAHLQKQLILSAIDAAKAGATIVYSTCSIMIEENEQVVDYALRKRNCKLVETGLGFGEHGFTRFKGKMFRKSLNLTRRFYPHTHNLDGFFVAKLVKK